MKAIILYRPNSEHETTVDGYVRDFKMQTGKEIELVSLDTIEGADMAKLYDIMSYPAVIALSDDGVLQRQWQGESLPLINEISYYQN